MIDVTTLPLPHVGHAVTLSVPAGGRRLVVGPSGSGKSTLLRCIAGLTALPADAPAAAVVVDGERDVWARRRRLAMVAQVPHLPAGRVRDALAAPLAYHANRGLAFDAGHAETLLADLGLPGALDRDTAALSGGERQRVALAGAVLLGRPALLLDEPTSALDDAAAERVVALLSRLDAAILVAAHDVARYPDWPKTELETPQPRPHGA